jgi:hypothetical protein
MKAITFRVPDEIADWLREKAAVQTIKQKRQVSINSLVLEMFRREMEADQKKGGT